MKLLDYLEESGVEFEASEHRPAFTAQHLAAEEHEPGKYVAKPVIIKADGNYMMCVLPASCKIDLDSLKRQLGVKSLELAEEKDIAAIFGDCALGAEPPFGNLYDLPTIMDKALEDDDHITFQAGTHEKTVRMSMDDYRRLVNPRILEFSYHMSY
jgi:Ala-tRNA(Pro) deacylase